MRKIRKLMLKNVRCFADEQELVIRPITFLVGENSTGKSTALGCMQAMGSMMGRFEIDFNIEPYQMGAFADIVRRTRSRGTEFQLGFEVQISEDEFVKHYLTLAERETGSEPTVSNQRIIFRDGEIELRYRHIKPGAGLRDAITVEINNSNNGSRKFDVYVDSERYKYPLPLQYIFWQIMFELDLKDVGDESMQKLMSFLQKVEGRVDEGLFLRRGLAHQLIGHERIYSLGPVRSKPKRTHDPLRSDEDPEGSDVPVLLMNLSKQNPREWEKLKQQLLGFGKSSGLFTDITVRKLGDSINDPFQLQFRVKGPKANLIDVGYGVSQILPILVRIFWSGIDTTFLLQQPEVHLHPKAQAELSSLLIDRAMTQHQNFVIETHSDHMVDRARIEIMNGTIEPEDVSLVFMEPSGNQVKVHNITFDKQANLIGVPDSYRDFFLRESGSLLGFEG